MIVSDIVFSFRMYSALAGACEDIIKGDCKKDKKRQQQTFFKSRKKKRMNKEEEEFYKELHEVTKFRFKEGFSRGFITGAVIASAIIGFIVRLV